MNSSDVASQVAAVLIDIGAVGFSPQQPVVFKSGLLSPVYVDNRRLPYWPAQWKTVLNGFQTLLRDNAIPFDVIAGMETAGIPHSAALGYALERPSVFVRKQTKDHGTRSRVEGGPVRDRQVLLIEDLVTTGSSSLLGVDALRQDGARVTDCLAIVSYGFRRAREAFDQADVRLHTLTSFPVILDVATKAGRFTDDERSVVEDWLRDPYQWATDHR